MHPQELSYLAGFGNEFVSEALPGAVPPGLNNPQKPAYGLYAEQLSGSAFTAPNAENKRSWLYRILPSVRHKKFTSITFGDWCSGPFNAVAAIPDQLRWDPWPAPQRPLDFIESIVTICGNGDASQHHGSAVHLYHCNQSMHERVFYNADGDLLIVPQHGRLHIVTEFGRLNAEPQEIVVIPRGIKFQVHLLDGRTAGYICENYGEHFQLPYRGPIGANGLANARDFLTPTAHYEDKQQALELVCKFEGGFWSTDLEYSPFDVVGWFGNYVPYKYDLRRFNTMGSISFDHPDPSIFTVLTSPSARPGTANVDFVIFPPRWLVAQDTFRPPYYHRNIMSEYMGLIHGVYDAKTAGGFVPGGGSLHNCMSAHGPDADAFLAATNAELKPQYIGDTMAFMFESMMVYRPTRSALETPNLQSDYIDCWQSLKRHFNPAARPAKT